MFIAITLSLAATGFLLWLLFNLAVYALPFYAGLSAAMWAYQHDAGFIGAALVGLVVAGLTFGMGQGLFATLRSPWRRALVAAVYAGPAGVAGYFAVYGVSGIGGTGEVWRILFASVGAVIVAGVAWVRVSALHPGHEARQAGPPRNSSFRHMGAANDG
ncbi:MAG: hypothetical protein ACK4K7_10225 [Allosphingosinicella sp.]|uniref:hypothetical protein n=1 Tax=Allosphingosinicella sp. TaxID=2823234 RepID=UPI00395FC401